MAVEAVQGIMGEEDSELFEKFGWQYHAWGRTCAGYVRGRVERDVGENFLEESEGGVGEEAKAGDAEENCRIRGDIKLCWMEGEE